jgi:hypothetical protein
MAGKRSTGKQSDTRQCELPRKQLGHTSANHWTPRPVFLEHYRPRDGRSSPPPPLDPLLGPATKWLRRALQTTSRRKTQHVVLCLDEARPIRTESASPTQQTELTANEQRGNIDPMTFT